MQNHLIIAIKDIQAIRIECPKCESHVYMQATPEIIREGGLEACPVCCAAYDTTLANNLKKLVSLLQRISESTKISLQVETS